MNFDDASKALLELAASRHNAFHTSEAAEIQVTNQRLRRAKARGEVVSLHPKVWSLRSLPKSPMQSLRAATLSVPASAASYLSAAWLHGWIDLPPKVPQVWVRSGSNRRPKSIAVRQRNLVDPNFDVTQSNHIRTLNKAATLCLLGAVASPLLVEKCLDEFLRTESEEWLLQTLERLYRDNCAGTRCLKAVLNDPKRVSGVPDSWFERVVANLINLPWLPPIVLQHPVTIGGREFRLDIACPELKLGVEAHSRSFHWGPGKEDADNARDVLLTSAGWQLLYVTYAQLRDPDEFVRLFGLAARARADFGQIELAK